MEGFRHESLLSSLGENRNSNSHFWRVQSNFEAIPAPFLFIFSISQSFPSIITWKLKNIFFGEKLRKKARGTPCFFLQFLVEKIIFEFSDYYTWKRLRDTKNE